MNWREFKPTIFFLTKFLGIYLAGNILYGLFITNFEPHPDPITRAVTVQSAKCLDLMGWSAKVEHREKRPTSAILYNNHSIVTVYEGCNGVNVMIIFVAFLVAFGPFGKSMTWFAVLGLAVIHVSNLFRIILLFIVTMKMPDYLYVTHKYLFTAFIYAFVFVLWMIWVRFFSKPEHGK